MSQTPAEKMEAMRKRRIALVALLAEGVRDRAVLAAHLKVSIDTIERDFRALGTTELPQRDDRAALAARDRRLSVIDDRDLTAIAFGDPEPGRSALDQKGIAT